MWCLHHKAKIVPALVKTLNAINNFIAGDSNHQR